MSILRVDGFEEAIYINSLLNANSIDIMAFVCTSGTASRCLIKVRSSCLIKWSW